MHRRNYHDKDDITEAERLAIEQAIFADMDAAHADPTHPRWHLTPPSHCMIDFWGAADVDSWHHIFYHTFRYAGKLGEDTVFGHARSRDFLQYELLPLPICPAQEELRMNDGFICMRPDGTPVMLYTSVPRDGSPRSHYAAVGDKELLRFERCPEPFMTLENHGGPAFGWGWSDPFVFEAFGRTFMLMSKCVTMARSVRRGLSGMRVRRCGCMCTARRRLPHGRCALFRRRSGSDVGAFACGWDLISLAAFVYSKRSRHGSCLLLFNAAYIRPAFRNFGKCSRRAAASSVAWDSAAA